MSEISKIEQNLTIKKIDNQTVNISINNKTIPSNNTVPSSTEASSVTNESKSGTKITSPIIGTAYHAPEPGAKKFIDVGKKIKKGDTIMIVEAMKTMNHIPSTSDGIVKEILVADGQPVEFGQTLIILE